MGTARPSVTVCPCATRSRKLERTSGWRSEARSWQFQDPARFGCRLLAGVMVQPRGHHEIIKDGKRVAFLDLE
jgi:hypothetical protein